MKIVKKWFGTWIKPEQGLPCEGQRVLVQIDDWRIEIGIMKHVREWQKTDDVFPIFIFPDNKAEAAYSVTAWMPLPKPMIEEEHDG